MVELYTDGAVKNGNIGWGFVAVKDEQIIFESCGMLSGPEELLAQRNVAGEMKAVLEAVSWADSCGFTEICILYDYVGCYNWPLEFWSAGNEFTQAYAKFMKGKMKKLTIDWKHVKGHSGNKWNDYADMLAKAGASGERSKYEQVSSGCISE